MPTRNTAVLQQILEALEISEPHALARLETLFQDSFLAVASDVNLIASQAKELRLAINTTGCGQVLDHLAPHARISLDQTGEVINKIYPNRFIEP